MKNLLNKKVIVPVLIAAAAVATALGAPEAVIDVLQFVIDALQPVAEVAQ